MRVADQWKDYELIDCSDGERLERWGDHLLIRPDPQVIWSTPRSDSRWKKADARYLRSNTGGGKWEVYRPLPDSWNLRYGEMEFRVKTMGFKHTGIFPEQAVNWELTSRHIRASDQPPKMLNLFAYTGCATVSALAAGATVTHVDASKGMVQWAKENAAVSGVAGRNVRWLVDDCKKFVERELRRGNRYEIIIMDPPSYGRGPGGEVWKLENEVFSLVSLCANLLLYGGAVALRDAVYFTVRRAEKARRRRYGGRNRPAGHRFRPDPSLRRRGRLVGSQRNQPIRTVNDDGRFDRIRSCFLYIRR